MSVREPTEDKLPTTFSGQKEAIRSLPPSWDCTRKKTGSLKPSLELVLRGKTDNRRLAGPVLASLNIRRPKDTVNQETRASVKI